jgi:23S rRNA (pseudouridine1915-N3)-methyltransferase
MKIQLVWIGKTKERFILEGITKYLALLKPYAEVTVSELREERGDETRKMLAAEGKRILKTQKPYILLDEKGEQMDSVAFAGMIGEMQANPVFVLGGAFGVSDEVKERASRKIALSRMTFTHEMARVFFLEQLYRAFTILKKRGYHH